MAIEEVKEFLTGLNYAMVGREAIGLVFLQFFGVDRTVGRDDVAMASGNVSALAKEDKAGIMAAVVVEGVAMAVATSALTEEDKAGMMAAAVVEGVAMTTIGNVGLGRGGQGRNDGCGRGGGRHNDNKRQP